MSLLNTVASTPLSEVCAFRRDRSHVVVASCVRRTSSFGIGSWAGPLGSLLNEVMLDGAVIDPSIAHDRDVPRYHNVARTQSLARRIDEAFAKAGPARPADDTYDDWVRSELSTAHEVVRTAARRGECVVTAWEVIGGVRGVEMKVRELLPGQAMPLPPLALPPPLVIAGCVAGGILAAAIWRQRRMRIRT